MMVAGLLGMGWIFYAAIAKSKIQSLRENVKRLEEENDSLRKKRSN